MTILEKKLEMFDFSNYFAGSKYYLNALVVGKSKIKWVVLLLKNLSDES